ncbi:MULTISPECIES: sugar ABC transporter substrate-binding protein [unclassified Nocardioides]|uniref:sugar ABC transporter substrate-binding protein n=1 Tax=unclassified Nocardioides TaxID=2615069 RepID=UPI0006FB59CE|nr:MULTISPECIES: substrate-binding domain-containing protein [unclassified Nocardioides]KRA38330.1 sugar ABC transporter substrate-binding protein [Nocardioides sp. Root614]KRA92289.1 sugar ABC transporter substrate-binding protein [Nocardioides sp. Root682]
MKRTHFAVVAAGLGLALSLSACGSDDGDKTSDDKDGAVQGKIGVILPDTESSVRWESADRPALEAAFKKAGIDYAIQNTEGSAEKMTQLAESMIGDGVTVLAIVNLDSASGAAIEEKAKASGVLTLDYDRLTLGGSAEAYISYDNNKVGELQAQGLADCLGDKDANIVYLNGSPTDNNATLFAAGAHKVLDTMTNYKVVGEQAVPDWDNEEAARIFQQLYTAADGKVDGVLAANDGLGGAAIGVLEGAGQAGKVPVTGQDATAEGLQNILAGTQCMTVFKSSVGEANALADAAIALAKGDKPATTDTVKDDEGGRDVPSVILDPVAITKDNIAVEIKNVFADGSMTYDDVCTGKFEKLCTDAGITK